MDTYFIILYVSPVQQLISTVGWKKKYWDHGRQFYDNDDLINQVHHFAAFFIAGLENPGLAGMEAFVLDPPRVNKQDYELALQAIEMAQKVKNGETTWENLPKLIFEELRD